MTIARAAAAAAALSPLAGPQAHAAWPGSNGSLVYVQGDIGAVAPHGLEILGGNPQEIGPTCQEGEPDPCPLNPSWSRDGKHIAFDLGGDIARIRPDGTGLQVFDVPNVTASRPAWSPDGDRIVFEGQARNARVRNLYVMGADGSGPRRLTSRGGRQPAWSLDDRIAFARGSDLFVMKSNGSRLRRLTYAGGGQPNWSPRARTLAFTRRGNVWRIAAAGGRPRRLTGKGGLEPAWRPDGRSVLFVRTDGGGSSVIYAVDSRGRRARLVTAGDEGRGNFVYDPDQQPR